MEIIWPGNYCHNDKSTPHYWIQLDGDKCEWWKCINCSAVKYHAASWLDLCKISAWTASSGVVGGYRKAIMANGKRLRMYLTITGQSLTREELDTLRTVLDRDQYKTIRKKLSTMASFMPKVKPKTKRHYRKLKPQRRRSDA